MISASMFMPMQLYWKLNYDPQSRIGEEIDMLMQLPEPSGLPDTLYRLSSGQMCEFFDIEYGQYEKQLLITFTSLFEKLTRKQREIVLANLLGVLEMCKGMLADQQTLYYIKSSFSARLNALMQRERYAGDFGQDEGAEQ